MAPSSANGAQPRDPEPQPDAPTGAPTGAQTGGGDAGPAGPAGVAGPPADGVANPAADDAAISTAELLELLGADRLWLLQQIDAGHWPDLRLDLAALERELGQLLDQAAERLPR